MRIRMMLIGMRLASCAGDLVLAAGKLRVVATLPNLGSIAQ